LVTDVEPHTRAAYVSIECKRVLYSRILLGMVNEESCARRGNILRNVPVALWWMVCRCLVNRSLESKRSPRYFTVLDQGIVVFWN
jgi:hypothetical protein